MDELVNVNFDFEVLAPLEGIDRIYAEYAKTFGRYPDNFMFRVVAQTKEDLFTWWAPHRDDIREALVDLEAKRLAARGVAPTVQASATQLSDLRRAADFARGNSAEGTRMAESLYALADKIAAAGVKGSSNG